MTMDNPFGVPHEISKVRFRRVSPQASQQIKDSYAKSQARKAKFRAAGQKIADAPGKVANTKVSLNDIGRGVGMGTAKVGTAVGRGLSYKPGLTGAAVIGGTGYGLYRHGNTKKKKVDTAPTVVTKSAFGVEDIDKALRFPGVQPFGPGAAKYTGDAAKHLKGLKKAPVTKKPEIGGGKIHTEKGNR